MGGKKSWVIIHLISKLTSTGWGGEEGAKRKDGLLAGRRAYKMRRRKNENAEPKTSF